MVFAACGLAGGIAAAAPAPSFHWCPGQPWDPAGAASTTGTGTTVTTGRAQQVKVVDGQRALGSPAVLGAAATAPAAVGPRRSVMWNMTARAWGFWNNKIWTPL